MEAPALPVRVGRWSAAGVVIVGVLYVAVLARGIAVYGLATPIGDPILAVMEILTIISAILVLMLVAAIVDRGSNDQRVFGTLALVFIGLFAGTTIIVHLVALSAGRQLGMPLLVWPSVFYAAELAAWGGFLGVGLVFTALGMQPTKGRATIPAGLTAAGALCLLGLIGPVIGRMPLQRIGIVGYAVVLPAVCALIFRDFGTGRPLADRDEGSRAP